MCEHSRLQTLSHAQTLTPISTGCDFTLVSLTQRALQPPFVTRIQLVIQAVRSWQRLNVAWTGL